MLAAPHVSGVSRMDTPPPPNAEAGEPASTLLNDLGQAFPEETVSVGDLLDRLDSRANGVVLLVLALPMCIPNVPGISTIFGVLMLAPALQLLFGQRLMWVPKQLRDLRVDAKAMRKTFAAAIPTLKRVEYLIKPRFSRLTRFPITILIGFQTLVMALILILPIPAGNWPPGMIVALTALALLQRDGLLMLLTSVASFALVYFGGRFVLLVLHGLIEWVQRLF
jgi:hypothetical protein